MYKAAGRPTRVTRKHVADVQRLLALMGVPCVDAPGEAEASCAALVRAERAYAVDVRYPLMTVATAERKIVVVNLTNPQTIYTNITSPLKYQSRCIACFPDQQGFCLGSIEGRCVRRPRRALCCCRRPGATEPPAAPPAAPPRLP